MSARSHQVRALARDMSARAGARVEIRYDRPGEWFAERNSGPALEEMNDILQQLLGTGRYPDLQEQKIGFSRHVSSPAAWAARAIAAHRDRRGLSTVHPW